MGTGKLFWDTWQNTEGTISNRLLFRLGEYSDTHVSFILWIVGYTPTVWQHESFSTYTILHFTPSAESKRVFHFFLGAKNSRENCRTRSRTYKACRWEQQAEDGEADNSKWTCCWQLRLSLRYVGEWAINIWIPLKNFNALFKADAYDEMQTMKSLRFPSDILGYFICNLEASLTYLGGITEIIVSRIHFFSNR